MEISKKFKWDFVNTLKPLCTASHETFYTYYLHIIMSTCCTIALKVIIFVKLNHIVKKQDFFVP